MRRTSAPMPGWTAFRFNVIWRQRRDRPKILVICDVSGSVAHMALPFLLLWSMKDVVPTCIALHFRSDSGRSTKRWIRNRFWRAAMRAILRERPGMDRPATDRPGPTK
ncbi:MAG: hypothetical protein R3C04_02945 [Hyphomonas sp.]